MKNSLTDSVPAALERELVEIEKMQDCKELRRLLVRALSVSVEQIIRMGAIVRRLEELGDDLSDMELSLLPQIRKVAHGQVSPQVVHYLMGKPSLFRKVSALPMPDQKRIASGEPLKVLLANGDHCMVSPTKMNGKEIAQVFAADHIRDDAEQASWLREHAPPAVPSEQVWDKEKIYLDRRRQGLVVGQRFIPASDLAHYLSQLTEKAKTPH